MKSNGPMPAGNGRANGDRTPPPADRQQGEQADPAQRRAHEPGPRPGPAPPGPPPQDDAYQHGAQQRHPDGDKDAPPVHLYQGRRTESSGLAGRGPGFCLVSGSEDRGDQQPEAPGHRDAQRQALGPAESGRCRTHLFRVAREQRRRTADKAPPSLPPDTDLAPARAQIAQIGIVWVTSPSDYESAHIGGSVRVAMPGTGHGV